MYSVTVRDPSRQPIVVPAPVHIGCSGWQYKHWRGVFYPAALPATRWLEHYAAHFDTVEINNSFYRLPLAKTFAEWRNRVPSSFVYAVKASRYLTHMKKLNDPGLPVALFSRARRLGQRLGPVLYQLPPRWPRNLERLEQFLQALPNNAMHAIEFRDSSWYCDETFAMLTRYRVAMCLHDMAGSATGKRTVGPFLYVRFHGPQRIPAGIPTSFSTRGRSGARACTDAGRRSSPISTTIRPVMRRETQSVFHDRSTAAQRGSPQSTSIVTSTRFARTRTVPTS